MHPITVLAVLAMSLVAALYLFFSLKREIAQVRREMAAQTTGWERERQLWEARLAALEEKVETPPAPPVQALAAAVAGAGSSANLTRRSQALRRWRRGETAEQIAAALEMPRAEVDLLIKAYLAASPEASAAAAGLP